MGRCRRGCETYGSDRGKQPFDIARRESIVSPRRRMSHWRSTREGRRRRQRGSAGWLFGPTIGQCWHRSAVQPGGSWVLNNATAASTSVGFLIYGVCGHRRPIVTRCCCLIQAVCANRQTARCREHCESVCGASRCARHPRPEGRRPGQGDQRTPRPRVAGVHPQAIRARDPGHPGRGGRSGREPCRLDAPRTFDIRPTSPRTRLHSATTKADLAAALGVSVGRTEGFLRSFALVGLDSGGGIRTRDLRVMSPTSYQTAPPRGGPLILAAVGGIGEKNAARGRVRHPGAPGCRRGAGGSGGDVV